MTSEPRGEARAVTARVFVELLQQQAAQVYLRVFRFNLLILNPALPDVRPLTLLDNGILRLVWIRGVF